MKKQSQLIPTVSHYTVLRQLCNLIPPHLVPKLARETGVAEHERTFSSWSQTVALMFAHLTHAIGLNDVCDALRLNRGPLSAIPLPEGEQAPIANQWFDVRQPGVPPFSVCFSPHTSANISLQKVADAVQGADSSVLFAIMELAGSGTVMDSIKALGKNLFQGWSLPSTIGRGECLCPFPFPRNCPS